MLKYFLKKKSENNEYDKSYLICQKYLGTLYFLFFYFDTFLLCSQYSFPRDTDAHWLLEYSFTRYFVLFFLEPANPPRSDEFWLLFCFIGRK